ncbi:MAG: AAA family ATPase [Clostridia bacterium]|nr:AAA family ATPase [Clostridia bacterium]
MKKIPNSSALDRVISEAMKIAVKDKAVLTEDRFLCALFDLIEKDGNDAELQNAKFFLDMKKVDVAASRSVLTQALEKETGTSALSGVYINQKLFAARQAAAAKEKSSVSIIDVLRCMFESPSAKIKGALGGETAGADMEQMGDAARDFSQLFNKTKAESKAPEKKEEPKAEPVEDTKLPKDKLSDLVAWAKKTQSELKQVIHGQDYAIDVFVNGCFQCGMRDIMGAKKEKPGAVFVFAGPPGVGKTFLANEGAARLDGREFKRFDMSAYSDDDSVFEFCGFAKSYSNHKEGNVTGYVYRNPRAVLLFDEIEKAHIDVIHLFLQILDAGTLKDNNLNKDVSFKDNIIIFTTNAGRGIYEELGGGDFSGLPTKTIMKAIRAEKNKETGEAFFPEAICSRFATGNVIMFNHMTATSLCNIAKQKIEESVQTMKTSLDINIDVDDRVYSAMLYREGGAADARTVSARSRSFLTDEVYELFRLVSSDKSSGEVAGVKNIKFDVDLTNAEKDIVGMFESGDGATALVFGSEEFVKECSALTDSVKIIGAHSVEQALAVMKKNDVDFALVDYAYGLKSEANDNLNIEDTESVARDFFRFVRENKASLPMYLIEGGEIVFTAEECTSFMRRGARGFVRLHDEQNPFDEQMKDIAAQLYRQAIMMKLARENKVVTFETSQQISENGETAVIKLFDFKPAVAIDPDDVNTVLGTPSRPSDRFEDVLGAKEAKSELQFFVDYLKDTKKHIGSGIKAPRGVIMYGPPGTGKTMLARAMANEANATFISAQGNQFLAKYVGEGPEKVHEIFRAARKYAPTILFIDEIDAIAKERKGEQDGTDATLTAFLTEMDGFTNDPTRPVFVLAATNFDVKPGTAKSLDQALMRRFDRRVYVDLPNKEDRIKFFNMKREKNDRLRISDEQIENTAIRSTGMSLALLDNVIEMALRSALRLGKDCVDDAIFEEAFETHNGGEVKKWDSSQLERVARHEAGHALLCWLSGEKPSYLTIVARGDHGGYMQHGDNEGKAIYTKDEMVARIRTSLGGRAAEIVYYGDKEGVSTGASGDLQNATNVAKALVCAYGMYSDFGLAVVDAQAASGAMSSEIRGFVNKILDEQMTLALKTVAENKNKIDALVDALMTKNHLTGEEIDKVLSEA